MGLADTSIAQAIPKLKGLRIFYLLCFPTLLGAVTFLFCFRGLIVHPGNLAGLFATWWFVAAPILTTIALMILVRITWKNRWSGKVTALALIIWVVTLLTDAFFAFVMMANSP